MQQQLTIGALLRGGSYKIEKVLGQGSFGITYLAEHTNLGKKVAIKEFFMKELNSRGDDGSITGMTDGSLSYNYGQKFKKEAINLSRLDHPNIVRVTDSFDENGTYYYVMDYIEGQTLNDYVKAHHVAEDETVDIIKHVADALIYMHEEKHMLHLDLKPGNVMRRESDGHIFLIDFGLSKHYCDDGQPETSTTIGLGTPGYAPIEQGNKAKSGEFRPTIDVYALGATFYKLLTGETPPPASDLVSDDELLESNLYAKDVPENLIKVVKEAMCPNVRKRTQTVRDFKNNIAGVKVEKHAVINNTSVSISNGMDAERTIVTNPVVAAIVSSLCLSNAERTIVTNPGEEKTTCPEVNGDNAGKGELANIDPFVGIIKEEPMKHSIFSFKGRVGRLALWLTSFGGMALLALSFFGCEEWAKCWDIDVNDPIVYVCMFVFPTALYCYLCLTVGAKRCHDLGHSGWFQMIPFYGLVMLFASGDKKDNKYGEADNGISLDDDSDYIVPVIFWWLVIIFLISMLKKGDSHPVVVDEKNMDSVPDSVLVQSTIEQLVGAWKYTESQTTDDGNGFSYSGIDHKNEDGTFTSEGNAVVSTVTEIEGVNVHVKIGLSLTMSGDWWGWSGGGGRIYSSPKSCGIIVTSLRYYDPSDGSFIGELTGNELTEASKEFADSMKTDMLKPYTERIIMQQDSKYVTESTDDDGKKSTTTYYRLR